jgi:hypothetical protein
MILALLLAAAEPSMTAIDAERAFVADAQKARQWTAFRKYAADDADMFVPQQGQCRRNSSRTSRTRRPRSIGGRARASSAATAAMPSIPGPWVRQYGKAVGYFTTVWKRQPDGSWKWIYDGGDGLATARAEGGDIKPSPASCEGKPAGLPSASKSPDGSLAWTIEVGGAGQRSFRAFVWNGKEYQRVIEDVVAPPK